MANKFGPVRPKIHLNWKLSLPFIIMIAVTAVVVGLMMLSIFQFLQEYAAERQRQVSAQASSQVAGYVNPFRDQLTDAARGLTYASSDPIQQRNLLEQVQAAHSQFYDLAVIDVAGRETARKIRLVPDHQVALRNRAGSEAVQAALNGNVYLGSVYISEQLGALFVEMAAPVYSVGGEIVGALAAQVDLTPLWDVVKNIQVGQKGYVYVVDEQGRLIAYRESRVVQGPDDTLPDVSGVPEVKAYLGRDKKNQGQVTFQDTGLLCELPPQEQCGRVLAYYQQIEGTGWGVIVEQPTQDAYAKMNNLSQLALGLGVILSALAALLVWYIQRGVLHPLRVLSEGASALAGGQLMQRIIIRTGDEIEQLADEFNAMAQSLQSSQTQLEAFALEKSQEARTAQARVQEMTQLLEAGRAITSLDLENVLNSLAHEAARAVQADQCLIYLQDEQDNTLVVRGAWGIGITEYKAQSLKRGESAAGWVAEEKRELFLANVQMDRRFTPKTPTDRVLASLLALPLTSDDQTIGALQVATRSGKVGLSADEKQLIESFARQAAVAYKNAQLYEEERRRAREMKIVAEITRTISTSLDLSKTLDSILESVRELVPYDASEINLWEEREQVLRTRGRGGVEVQLASGNVYSLEEGHTGWIARKRQPLLVADVQTESQLLPKVDLGEFPLRAFAGVPLLLGNDLIGTLELASYQPGAFNVRHLETLQIVANQAAVAIQNARLYEETRQSAQEMATLREAAVEITSQLEPERILRVMIERAAALLRGHGGALYRVDAERQTLTVIVSYNMPRDVTGTIIRFGEGLSGRIAQQRQPMIINDYAHWEGRSAHYADDAITAVIGMPLIWQDELTGVLNVVADVENRKFDEDDIRLMTLFASQAAAALQNAELYGQLMHRMEEMAALHETAVDIASQLNPDQLLETIVQRAVELLHAKGGSLHRYDPAEQVARLIASYNMGHDYRGVVLKKGEGLVGEMLRNGQPLIVNDYQSWAKRSFQFAEASFTAAMGTPLTWQDRTLGALVVLDNAEQRIFKLNDLRLLMLLASQAVVALRNADLFAETQRRVTELDTLADIGRALSATLDVRGLLEVIADQTGRVMYSENLYIALYHPDVNEIEFALDTRADMPRTGRRRKFGNGITEYVIKTRQVLFLHDNVPQQLQERGIDAIGTLPASWVGVPLMMGERVLGVLSVQHYTNPSAYDESHVELLQSIGNQAAIALENARLFGETRRRLVELAMLTDIGQSLSSTLRIDELLQLVYEQTRRVMYAENMFIALYDQEHNEVEFALSRNPQETPPGMRSPADSGMVGHIIKRRKSVLLRTHAAEAVQQMGVEVVGQPSASWLGVPMLMGDRLLGVIAVQHYTNPNMYDDSHRVLLETIAAQAAIALENARLYQLTDVRLQQRVEELTGLSTISQELNTTFDLDRIFELVLNEAIRATRAQYGSIHLLDLSTGALTVRATHGYPPDVAERLAVSEQRYGEGIIGRVVETGLPIMVGDVTRDAGYMRIMPDTQSELCVPIGYAGSVAGAINLESSTVAHFTPDHTEYLQALASQAAIAIGNRQRYDEQFERGELLRQRAEQLATLFEISQAFRSDQPLEDTLDAVAHAIQDTVGYDIVIISIVEGDPPIRRRVAAAGIPVADFEELKAIQQPWNTMQDVLREEFRTSQSYYIPAEQREIRAALHVYNPIEVTDQPRQPGRWHSQDMLFVPLRGTQERVLGLISVDAPRDGNIPSRTTIETLEVFANQAASAIENALLFADLQRRVWELSTLYDSGEAVSSTLALEETLDVALQGVAKALDFDFVVLSLVDEQIGEVRAVRGTGVSESQIRLARRRLDDKDIMADIVRTGKTEVIEGWDERFDREMFEREGHAALVRVFTPLVTHGRNIGLVEAGYRRERRGRIAEHDIRLLRALADRIAAAVENARLFEETLSRTQELSALLDASSAISASLELHDVFTALADHLTRVIKVTGCALSRWDQEKQHVITLVDRLHQVEGPTSTGSIYPLQDYPLTRRVLDMRQPVMVYTDDPEADPNEVAILEKQDSKSLLMLPLIVREDVYGLIELVSNVPGHRFTNADIRMAQTLSNQAGVAISNAQLYDEIRGFTQALEQRVAERTEDLRQALDQLTIERDRVETLFRITSELQTSLDLDRVLNRALTLVNENIQASRALVLLTGTQPDALTCRAMIDANRPVPLGKMPGRFRRNEGLTGWCIRRRKAVIAPDLKNDPYWVDGEGGPGSQPRSALVVPLMMTDDVLGALVMVHSEVNHFNEAHLRLVEAAAAQVATAINNAELYRMIRESAERLGQMLRVQQEEASKSQAILEAVADGVMVADRHGRVALFNAAAERLLGSSRDEIIGRLTDDLLGLYGASSSAWANVVHEWTTSIGGRLKTPSLEQRLEIEGRHVRVHIAPVMLGDEYLGTVSIFHDMTKEVEVDRAKSDFVATVSHELRTPMTSVKGYADLLLLGAAGQLSGEQYHFMSIIKSNADRLSDLVNDLLNISRLESGRVELDIKPLRIDSVIEQVVTSLRGKIEEKGLMIVVQTPTDLPVVNADHDRTVQILTNLVSNAYQYTQPGGKITVCAHVVDGPMVQTDVIDTGVGISPADQLKVFDRFFRSDDTYVQEFAGTGLGLAIVKQLIQMHGGEIWLESEVGVGTTFSFTLPVVAESLVMPIEMINSPETNKT